MERTDVLKEYASHLIRQHGEEPIESLTIFEVFPQWYWDFFGTEATDEDFDEYLADDAEDLWKLIDSADVEITVTWNEGN